jgi:hypothetical protein
MPDRLALLEAKGHPAYTTSAGWFGFSDEKIRRLCREGLADGWTQFELKVGGTPEDDLRSGQIVRDEIGPHNRLMVERRKNWRTLADCRVCMVTSRTHTDLTYDLRLAKSSCRYHPTAPSRKSGAGYTFGKDSCLTAIRFSHHRHLYMNIGTALRR